MREAALEREHRLSLLLCCCCAAVVVVVVVVVAVMVVMVVAVVVVAVVVRFAWPVAVGFAPFSGHRFLARCT